MKKNFSVFLVFFVFLLVQGYLVYGNSLDKRNLIDVEIIHYLLSNRIKAMNRGLYTDEAMDDIIADLEKIERGQLLQEDIISLKDAKLNPTDYPMVIGLNTLKIDSISNKDNIYILNAEIQWDILEDSEFMESIRYLIEVEHLEGKFYLISLVPIQ